MVLKVLSLIRTGNLLMVALIFLLLRHTVILPILDAESLSSSVNNFSFTILLLSTILIAAGGYVINDILDVRADAINKPGKNPVGDSISRFTAYVLYVVFTLAGIGSAFYFGELNGTRYAALVFMLSSGLLYFYSQSYQKMMLLGNVVIALLSALTVMLPMLFDRMALQNEAVKMIVIAYAIFAFLMTLSREMIKDCEDMEGDGLVGAGTMPLVMGTSPVRKIAGLITFSVFLLILLIQISQQQWTAPVSFFYVTLFIQIPLLILAFRSFTAGGKRQDAINSLLNKLIMLTGILSMIIFNLSFHS